MISVEGVSKIYGKKPNAFAALKDVSFEVPDGATVAIVGKSGSGKSTLMHVVSGLDRPDEGSVVIDGQSISTLKRKAADRFRATGMGFVFQSFFVEGNQTVFQNVALPLEINRVPRDKRRAYVMESLESVGLAEKANEKARNLSGGQKQRLAIARAIVNKPRLLFADEPTGNLDSATGDKITDLLFGLNKSLGNTLIIVTHDLDLASRCQFQITLKDGEVTAIRKSRKKKKKVEEPFSTDGFNIIEPPRKPTKRGSKS
jgi:putative ABC transport system ATP-binding protein